MSRGQEGQGNMMLFQGFQKGPEKARGGLNSLQVVFSKELTRKIGGTPHLRSTRFIQSRESTSPATWWVGKVPTLVPTVKLPIPNGMGCWCLAPNLSIHFSLDKPNRKGRQANTTVPRESRH